MEALIMVRYEAPRVIIHDVQTDSRYATLSERMGLTLDAGSDVNTVL